MSNLNINIIDKIVQKCFKVYEDLPKTGKPIEKEWTVLSCIVKYDRSTEDIEVVSLGTGSKCVGATKMSPLGDILNDSHAEVFARRGSLLYLYDNIEKALQKDMSIFINDKGKLKLRSNIEFIFYSSQLPCGDASIIPKSGEQDQYGDVLKSLKREAEDKIGDEQAKKQKIDDDIFRTGAKCLPHCEQDPKEAGINYHLLSQVRIKPGRGDRTLSVSCSDKIARWIHLGIQGSLISLLCDPIYIKYFVFGAGVPYSEESLKRALLDRHPECSSMTLEVLPEFYHTSLVFANIKTEDNVRPAPGSIVWIKSKKLTLEVAVQGRKLGLTKKKAAAPSSSLCISKYNLYKRFMDILTNNIELHQELCGQDPCTEIPYNKMKRKSKFYIEKWLHTKENFFKTWTVKPDMWDFCISLL